MNTKREIRRVYSMTPPDDEKERARWAAVGPDLLAALQEAEGALREATGRLTRIDAALFQPKMDGSGVAEARELAALPRGVLHHAQSRVRNAIQQATQGDMGEGS